MTTTAILEAQSKLDTKRKRLAKTQREVANAERRLALLLNPIARLKSGAVIEFALQFAAYGKRYEYAARKVDSRWFTTGSTCPTRGYTDAQLVAMMRDAFACTDVRVLAFSESIDMAL